MYIFTLVRIETEAASEIGNRSAVSKTSKSEMPSMPTFHEMPQGSNHMTCLLNWKPASPGSNSHNT